MWLKAVFDLRRIISSVTRLHCLVFAAGLLPPALLILHTPALSAIRPQSSILTPSQLAVGSLASLQQTGQTEDSNQSPRRTPFLLGDLWYAGKTTLVDATRIYTSPARLNSRSALWLGGIVALGGVVYALDDELHAAVDRSRNDQPLKAVIDFGDDIEVMGNGGKMAKFYLGALALGYISGWDRLTWLAADVVESYYIAGVVKNAANVVASRERPRDAQDSREFTFNGDATSFPSGHAANVIQLANIISRHIDYQPVTIAAYSLAGAVSLQRISSDSHWPSDVYFAVVYGWFVSDEILRLNRERRVRVTPTAGIDGGLGVMLHVSL